MAGMAVTEDIGVFVGPIDRNLGPDQVARNVFRLFNSVGVRCSEIKKISVNVKGGYAKVELYAKDTENHAVKAIRDVKRVMNFYNLRKLTSKPKYFKVDRIGQRTHVSNERENNLPKDTMVKETPTSGFQYHYSLAWPSMLKQTVESEDNPGQSEHKTATSQPEPQDPESPEDGLEKEITFEMGLRKENGFEAALGRENGSEVGHGKENGIEVGLQKEHAFDVISLTQDSSSIDSQLEFEELEEERSEHMTMPTIHVATSTSGIPPPEQEPMPVLLDAKTSTPSLPVSFKESGFYHLRQKITTNMKNVHYEHGDILMKNVKVFGFTLKKTICAFLNTSGGVFYAGVRHDGVVVGINTGSARRNEDAIRLNIDCWVKELSPIVPITDYSVRFAGIMSATGHLLPDLKVLEIKVTPTNPPGNVYSYRGESYVWRRGQPWCDIGPS